MNITTLASPTIWIGFAALVVVVLAIDLGIFNREAHVVKPFEIDVLECPKCHEHMKLIALVTNLQSAARYLTKLGEPTDLPGRSKSRGPPYWKSTVLRRKAST